MKLSNYIVYDEKIKILILLYGMFFFISNFRSVAKKHRNN